MTTRVRVVYMFNKHVHALNLLTVSIITSVFRGRVRAWRLILKKNLLNTEMHITVLGLSRKLATMTRKFIPKNYIFNADTKTQRFFSEHGNAPCDAGAFKKISDDDQKIYSPKLYF